MIKAAKSNSAMEKVLSIQELFEAILLHLDMATLLISASRVNKDWNKLITTSLAIQRALFFIPGPRPPTSSSPKSRVPEVRYSKVTCDNHNTNSSWPVLNPLLEKKFGYCFFDIRRSRQGKHRSTSFARLPWSQRAIDYALVVSKEEHDESEDPNLDTEAAPGRRCFTRSGASWRRMLVSQPPPLSLGYWWKDLGADKLSVALVESKTLASGSAAGLRMGELYDIVQYRAGHHEYNSVLFRVSWCHPRPPFLSDYKRTISQTMLKQTFLTVEFCQVADGPPNARDPANVEAFDAAFRSEDFQHIEIEAEEHDDDSLLTPELMPPTRR